jgi:hypothetical protein
MYSSVVTPTTCLTPHYPYVLCPHEYKFPSLKSATVYLAHDFTLTTLKLYFSFNNLKFSFCLGDYKHLE